MYIKYYVFMKFVEKDYEKLLIEKILSLCTS